MNCSLLMQGMFTPTARKMKTVLVPKVRANKLIFLSSSTETGGRVITNSSSKHTWKPFSITLDTQTENCLTRYNFKTTTEGKEASSMCVCEVLQAYEPKCWPSLFRELLLCRYCFWFIHITQFSSLLSQTLSRVYANKCLAEISRT